MSEINHATFHHTEKLHSPPNSNWVAWESRITFNLIQRDLLSYLYIDSVVLAPEGERPIDTALSAIWDRQSEAYKTYVRNARIVNAQLILNLSDLEFEAFRRIMPGEVAPDLMYAHLKAYHQPLTGGGEWDLTRKLHNSDITKHDTVNEAFNELMAISSGLRAYGSVTSDSTLKITFLQGIVDGELLSTADTLRVDMSKHSLLALKQALETKESSVKTRKSENLLMADVINRAVEANMARLGYPSSSSGGPGGYRRDSRTCTFCQRVGHVEQDCFRKHPEKLEEMRERKRTRFQQPQQANYVSFRDGMSAMERNGSSYSYWLNDSGASRHMSNDRTAFQSLQKLETPVTIQMGNGAVSMATHSGTVAIRPGDGAATVTLEHVLYVPDLRQNLISLGQASYGSHYFVLDRGVISWIDRTSHQIIHTIKANAGNLFVFATKAAESATVASTGGTMATWHARLGHTNYTDLRKMLANDSLSGFDVKGDTKPPDTTYEPCLAGKTRAASHPSSIHVSTHPFQRIAADLIISDVTAIHTRAICALHLSDHYSKVVHHFPLKRKSDAADVIINLIKRVEKQHNIHVQELRTNQGGEFMNSTLQAYCDSQGIHHGHSDAYVHQQNGAIERANQTVINQARALLHQATLPAKFWSYACKTVCYIRKYTPSAALNGTSPIQLLCPDGNHDISHLRKFGSIAYVQIAKEKRKSKWANTRERNIMIGYAEHSAGYVFYNPESGNVREATDAVFDETKRHTDERENYEQWAPRQNAMQDLVPTDVDRIGIPPILPLGENSAPNNILEHSPSLSPALPPRSSRSPSLTPLLESPPPSPVRSVRHTRNNQVNRPINDDEIPANLRFNAPGQALQTNSMATLSDDELSLGISALSAACDAPPNFELEALQHKDSKAWRKAMEAEIQSLADNHTWTLESLPAHAKAIDNRWVYAYKTDEDGNVIRHKARLVAKGFAQRPGIDYHSVFAPTAKPSTQRLLFALAAHFGLEIHKLDVTTAFLHGDLDEAVYMKQPSGMVQPGQAHLVCKLVKSLYGLKQAARQWWLKLDTFFREELGMKRLDTDYGAYALLEEQTFLFVTVHIDDMSIAGTREQIDSFKQKVKAKFPCKDKSMKHHLGVRVTRDSPTGPIRIDQSTYIHQLLVKFGFSDGLRPATHPLPTTKLLPREEGESSASSQSRYEEMVGSLRCIAEWTRPDIAYAASTVARFLHNPSRQHELALNHIYRYLAHTSDYGITYSARPQLMLEGFSDASWAEEAESKSMYGYVYTINGAAISWKAKKQALVAKSSVELEFVAAAEAASEAIHLRMMLAELDLQQRHRTILHIDNVGALRIIDNPVFHERTKHINVKYYFVRDYVKSDIQPQYLCGTQQPADMFTKPIGRVLMERFVAMLGIARSK